MREGRGTQTDGFVRVFVGLTVGIEIITDERREGKVMLLSQIASTEIVTDEKKRQKRYVVKQTIEQWNRHWREKRQKNGQLIICY